MIRRESRARWMFRGGAAVSAGRARFCLCLCRYCMGVQSAHDLDKIQIRIESKLVLASSATTFHGPRLDYEAAGRMANDKVRHRRMSGFSFSGK